MEKQCVSEFAHRKQKSGPFQETSDGIGVVRETNCLVMRLFLGASYKEQSERRVNAKYPAALSPNRGTDYARCCTFTRANQLTA
jgi:hypothetical protein